MQFIDETNSLMGTITLGGRFGLTSRYWELDEVPLRDFVNPRQSC